MNIVEIYIANALTDAPPEFVQRMFTLRANVEKNPRIRVLGYNWKLGQGPDRRINSYVQDTAKIDHAKLVVAVIDYNSLGVGGEIEYRLEAGRGPLRLFIPRGRRVTSFVTGHIEKVRDELIAEGRHDYVNEFPDPIPYDDDMEIVRYIEGWVQDYLLIPKTGHFDFASA